MEVHSIANGDQIPGFWLLEAVEYIRVVSFIRERFDLHKSEKWVTDCLYLWIFDTIVSHGGCVMLWSLDMADKLVISVGGVHMGNFFAV